MLMLNPSTAALIKQAQAEGRTKISKILGKNWLSLFGGTNTFVFIWKKCLVKVWQRKEVLQCWEVRDLLKWRTKKREKCFTINAKNSNT
jgi:hypothetical protein